MGNTCNVKVNGEWREYWVEDNEFPTLLAWLEKKGLPLFKREVKHSTDKEGRQDQEGDGKRVRL